MSADGHANDAMGQSPGFAVPDPKSLPTLKGKVSAEEWRLRCELAATYRLAALYGWDDMIFTHISVRCPDEGGKARFLINPYGVFFDEMTACKTQILAQSDTKEPLEEPAAMGAKVLQQGAPAFVPGLGDNLAWPGLIRKLNRENPGFDV